MNDLFYLGNMAFDFTKTLKDYDFTKRSVVDLNRTITSDRFEDMPSDVIFRYLNEQMELVSFGDYLKRYIYEKTAPPESFSEVPEAYYVSVIMNSFTMNRAPYSFTPVKSRKSSIVTRWLRSDSVKRGSVFLLGFGLNMTDREVSEFLTRVIKEQDFRFDDPAEAVYWHCFHHGLPYSKAVALLRSAAQAPDMEPPEERSRYWEQVRGSLPVYLGNEKKLEEYLIFLRHNAVSAPVFDEFQKVFDRAVLAAQSVIREGRDSFGDGAVSGAYDIESALCSGIPRTKSKNVAAAGSSQLARQFYGKRLSRQRLGRILRREVEAERFDLITLLFLVYAITGETDQPATRCRQYIDEINALLERCRMMGIYPVNPYESFVLMCLLTEEPLTVYNDVWEISYTGQ